MVTLSLVHNERIGRQHSSGSKGILSIRSVGHRIFALVSDATPIESRAGRPQSCSWVGLTRGLGWIGNGSKICDFSGLGWVMGLK